MKRKIFKVNRAGSIGNLKLHENELPLPAPHEVTIAVRAIGLNFADVFAMLGLYSATPEGAFIPGLEYAGEIIAVGKKVQGFKKGDLVMGVTRFGAYATHLNIDYAYVSMLPNGWSFEEGAAYLVQALTAYYGLVTLGGLKAHHRVLIHSAAGGVGLFANRIARLFGATTTGTVGHSDKFSVLHEEGYHHIVLRKGQIFSKLMDASQGHGFDIVMECIGGQVFKDSYNAMARAGRLVAYGAASFATPNKRPNYLKVVYQYLRRPLVDPLKMIQENKAVMGFNLIWLYDQKDMMRASLDGLQKLDLGKPRIGHQYPFEGLPNAINDFQKGGTIGKLVVRTMM